jgi:hypothetical protein
MPGYVLHLRKRISCLYVLRGQPEYGELVETGDEILIDFICIERR